MGTFTAVNISLGVSSQNISKARSTQTVIAMSAPYTGSRTALRLSMRSSPSYGHEITMTDLRVYNTPNGLGGDPVDQQDTQNLYSANTIPGISLLTSLGNTLGVGVLSVSVDNGVYGLSWSPSGGGAPNTVYLYVAGVFSLFTESGEDNGVLVVDVIPNKLEVGTYPIKVSPYLGFISDVPRAKSQGGGSSYLCLYLVNSLTIETLENVYIHISKQPLTSNDMAIGLDPVGVGGTAQTVSDESTETIGVSYLAHGSDNKLYLGDIPPGVGVPIWVRRYTKQNSYRSAKNDLARLVVRRG